ncbi:hypothetical protein DPMN_044629 [Dreissena polymorpha]|uniref:Uncharacterized protein n=1 Tax=Dreissena polymorpha TaxID=45954 RepID=A0A9D4HYX1_DREPO|nr:hypothetical protein DPMN_044629 [Dreissena polymorpha]
MHFGKNFRSWSTDISTMASETRDVEAQMAAKAGQQIVYRDPFTPHEEEKGPSAPPMPKNHENNDIPVKPTISCYNHTNMGGKRFVKCPVPRPGLESGTSGNVAQCVTTRLPCASVFRNLADTGKAILSCAVTPVLEPVLSTFLKVHLADGRGVTCWILLGLTFARFVAGAVKLRSDCDKEQCVAMYLFVKGVLGLILWTTFLVVRRLMPKKKDLEKDLEKKTDLVKERDLKNNRFVTVYICVDSLFGFGWSILGMVWVFGNYSAMISECPGYVSDWNFNFINFAMFVTVADLVVVVVFIIFVLCKECCGNKK